jgi:hypothetical protein
VLGIGARNLFVPSLVGKDRTIRADRVLKHDVTYGAHGAGWQRKNGRRCFTKSLLPVSSPLSEGRPQIHEPLEGEKVCTEWNDDEVTGDQRCPRQRS